MLPNRPNFAVTEPPVGEIAIEDSPLSRVPVTTRRRVGLVLPGGGARGAFQAGILARLGEEKLLSKVRIITGVSAGAINGAFLANHTGGLDQAAIDLADMWANLRTPRVLGTSPVALVRNVARWASQLLLGGTIPLPAPQGLLDTAPLAELLHMYLGRGEQQFAGLDENLRNGCLDAFAITTTNYNTARAVTFAQQQPGAPLVEWHRPYREGRTARLTVDHILASAAIPVLFPAIKLGNSWHGDGSIRQTAPLSPALHLGAEKLLILATSGLPGKAEPSPDTDLPYPSPAQVLGVVLNAILFDHISYDIQNLNRISELARQSRVPNPSGMRVIDTIVVRPSADLGAMAAAHERDLPRSLQYLTRGWGSKAGEGSDILATVTFDHRYTARLVELGRMDADQCMPNLRAFIED
jgi:NTE family protein